jgi:hypothetical protein
MARSPEVEHLQKAAIIASRLVKNQYQFVTEPETEEAETQERRPEAS